MQIPDLYQPIIEALQNSSGKADKKDLFMKIADIEGCSEGELKKRLGGEVKLKTNGFRYDWALSDLKQSGYVSNSSIDERDPKNIGEWELKEKGWKVDKLTEEEIQDIYGKATSPNLKALRKKLMVENLKVLRKTLMVDVDTNIKSIIDGWHANYKGMVDKVYKERQRLLKSNSKLSEEDDKEFLERLIYEDSNGITSTGWSKLHGNKDKFNYLIRDKNFLNELTDFIINPSEQGLQKVWVPWEKATSEWAKMNKEKPNSHPLLINRIASACTLEVSSVADHTKFWNLFENLIKKEIIDEPPFNIENGEKYKHWFCCNQILIKRMREIFGEELYSHTIDEIGLNQFVWYVCAYFEEE